MERYIPHKFQLVRIFTLVSAIYFSLNFCQDLWAAQDALVIIEKAVIYADEQMSAPVGFVRKGKKVKIGENARNKAQVYPIVVSGKVAYIRAIDVSTERESNDSAVLVAERFQKASRSGQAYNYAVSFFNYSTQIDLEKENDELKNKDAVNWYGVGIRGGALVSPKWEFDVLLNLMNAKAEKEVFRAVEFGIGGAARIFDKGRFKLRGLLQLLAIPYSSYALADEFRVNGYGFTTGGGLNMAYRMGKNFGMEVYGGFYYTKLSGFKSSVPYNPIAPSFLGSRLGVGLNYQF